MWEDVFEIPVWNLVAYQVRLYLPDLPYVYPPVDDFCEFLFVYSGDGQKVMFPFCCIFELSWEYIV